LLLIFVPDGLFPFDSENAAITIQMATSTMTVVTSRA